MTKKSTSQKTVGNFQTQTRSFAPRPFSPVVQKKGESNSAATNIQDLSASRNVLSRMTVEALEPFTPQLTLQRSEKPIPQGAAETQSAQSEKIQPSANHHNRLEKVSILPPKRPPTTPSFPIQRKLTVGAVGDKYEREADRVAQEVVQRTQAPCRDPEENRAIEQFGTESDAVQPKVMLQQQTRSTSQDNKLQMKPMETLQREAMEDKSKLQMKPTLRRRAVEGSTVSAEVEREINNARGSGQRLAPEIQMQMGEAMGADFSGVRVHEDARADALNRSVGARAFTTGRDVFFKQGEYKPESREGQELIAHELTHVKQQNEGKVQQSSPDNQSLTSPTSNTIQRKISFSGFDLIEDRLPLYKTIKQILEEAREALLEIFSVEDLAKIGKTVIQDTYVFWDKLDYMSGSPEDYGEINLDNPQHLVMFFKDYLKIDLNDRSKIEELRKKSYKQEEEWDKQKYSSPSPVRTYKTALLGTGASIADYINVHGRSLDPDKTVIIGKTQPWDPSPDNPESRGIDFVNHPMHMTSPLRDKNPIPLASSGLDETFKGNAKKLTKDIEKVLRPYLNFDAKVKKVSRDKKTKWYKIETDNGDFYALNVVSGLGIGSHQKPRNALAKQVASREDKATEKKRVMDLDTFQRQLKDPQSDLMKEKQENPNPLAIGVSGPNAGVDAAYEATKLGMAVKWVVSSGPAIAEGMGNKITNKSKVELYFDYLKGWTFENSSLVKLSITGKRWQEGEREKVEGELESQGWEVSHNNTASVNYLVYAVGPAVEEVWNIFDESTREDLELKYDKQGRFGGVDNESDDVSLKNEENVYKAIEKYLASIHKYSDHWFNINQRILQKAKEILGVQSFTSQTAPKDVAIGIGSEDDSFQIIGGSAIRILDRLDEISKRRQGFEKQKQEKEQELEWKKEADEYGYEDLWVVSGEIVSLDTQIQELKKKTPKELSSGKTAEKMRKVVETLSTPTILNNDQLTPIRSQVEALGDYIPVNVGTEESNFVTDDRTMIAAQIASNYENIPPTLANWITQKIIQERHDDGVKPGTSKGSREFMDLWKWRLSKLDHLFDPENIARMI